MNPRAYAILFSVLASSALSACSTGDTVVQTRPAAKGAVGTDHSGYTDDISRALHDQRRDRVATP